MSDDRPPESLHGEYTATELAELAYRAYGDFVEWKNYAGEPMPTWADLPLKIHNAWVKAARAVARAVREEALSGR